MREQLLGRLSVEEIWGIAGRLTRRLNAPWLREWGLGISIIVGLIVAYFAHGAGLGPAT